MLKARKKILSLALASLMSVSILSGCQNSSSDTSQTEGKTFTFGDTTFNAENGISNIDPHTDYSGWACIRYGVGETLFHYSDSMEMEPWLASSYEQKDPTTWVITLQDQITFSSGRTMDAAAVKECLEHLISVHERAKGDLKIQDIQAENLTLTITTTDPVPALIHYLSDPYGCIIDMQASENTQGIVSGTGPYIAVTLETNQGLTLKKNPTYWNDTPNLDTIYVRTISDGDTLTMALQSGELDAAYGLPYSSLPLFASEPYTISSCETSRSFFAQMNFSNEILQDERVREAIAMAIDKDTFVSVLLDGNGTAAAGPFPSSFRFGDSTVTAPSYDPETAKKLLTEAGWTDSDGDGYVDKNGETLTLRWLTYPSRQELPLLAETAQSTLKEIGIQVDVTCTANHLDILESGAWDLYASAFVCAPTGDPEYFFTTHCLDQSSKNRGQYHNDQLESLEEELANTFDMEQRSTLASQMTQILLDDHAFVFASHLKMSLVSGKGVTGLTAHPSDYYEITVDLDKTSES